MKDKILFRSYEAVIKQQYQKTLTRIKIPQQLDTANYSITDILYLSNKESLDNYFTDGLKILP